jgi:hypothetical protein
MKAFAGKTQHYQEGMDLRDYFAAKAMQSLLSSKEFLVITNLDKAIRLIAEGAYQIADTMMEVREQG